MTNFLFYNNLVTNSGDEGIRLITSTGNRVYNNTIYNVTRDGVRGGIYLVTTSPNNTLKNNIVWENGSATNYSIYVENAASQAGLVSDNNDLYVTSSSKVAYLAGADENTLPGWQAASGQDTHSLSADPLFLNVDGTDDTDFKLNNGSPCAEAGMDLSGVFTTDYFGSTRTAPWSQGIYELEVPPTPAPTPTATPGPSSTAVSSPASSAGALPETGASASLWAILVRTVERLLIRAL